MKYLLLLWLFLGVYGTCYTQVITIKASDTNLPLEQVTLYSQSSKAFVTTDAKGQAEISVFSNIDKIRIRMIGYQELIASFEELKASNFVVMLHPIDYSLDQVVVSATRWKLPKRDIPNRIAILTKSDMGLQNPQTAADLLGNMGEIFIQKSQLGGGSPMIRGFSTNRLLYAVDGVRMNTAIFRSGNLQNVISLDPFAIDRTEVFFGPGSVIYGSDAIGGVMSFQTLNPALSSSEATIVDGNATTRYASANKEQTMHFDLNVGWKKWAYVASFSNFNFDDLRMGAHGPAEYLRPFFVQRQDSNDVVITNDDPLVQRPTGYSQMNLMQKLRFKPNEHWDLQYGFHYSTTSDYARYDRHIRLRNGLPRSAEWNYGPQIWMMNNLSVTHDHPAGALYDHLTLRLAYQYFEESRIDRDFNKFIRYQRIESVKAYSANIDFLKRIHANGKLFYGLEMVYNDVHSAGLDEDIRAGTTKPGPARYPNSNWASYAAYATYHHQVSDKVMLQAGARYNQFVLDAVFNTTFYDFPFTTANINNGALTGSMGLVFHPKETWSISANLSSGFRSPNIDDVGKVFDSEPGSVVIPNPALKAEYAYNTELGLSKILGNKIKFDLSAYYTLLKNALVRRDFTLNGASSILYEGEMSQVQAIQNAAEARVYGIQAAVEIKLPDGFGISSQINFQKGEEELDDGSKSPSRHAPPTFGITHLTYQVEMLRLDFSWIYNAEKSFDDLPEEEKGKDYIYAIDDNGNPYSPGWQTLNFKAMFQFTEQLSASAGVENLLDKRYRPYSSGIVAPGRNLILSFKANF
ncbi:MAG: TonB-dependent receptor [Saprospiraceae bacterium]